MQKDDRDIFKSPFQSSEDCGNAKITQHALKVSRACKTIKLDTIGKKNEKSFESSIELKRYTSIRSPECEAVLDHGSMNSQHLVTKALEYSSCAETKFAIGTRKESKRCM